MQPADAKWAEVSQNKMTLERVLHHPIHLFSYPYGDFDAEVIAAVRKAGFFAAVTVQAGLVRAGTNRFLLPRCEITAADGDRFPARLRDIFEEPSRALIGMP